MEWLMAITIVIISMYANRLTKENTSLKEDRDYWRRKAIRANADKLRLEVQLDGNSEEEVSI